MTRTSATGKDAMNYLLSGSQASLERYNCGCDLRVRLIITMINECAAFDMRSRAADSQAYARNPVKNMKINEFIIWLQMGECWLKIARNRSGSSSHRCLFNERKLAPSSFLHLSLSLESWKKVIISHWRCIGLDNKIKFFFQFLFDDEWVRERLSCCSCSSTFY